MSSPTVRIADGADDIADAGRTSQGRSRARARSEDLVGKRSLRGALKRSQSPDSRGSRSEDESNAAEKKPGKSRKVSDISTAVENARSKKEREHCVLADIIEYDANLDRVNEVQKHSRCRLLMLINRFVEILPFPCGIRPLPCIRRKGWCHRTFEANRCCFFLARQGSAFLGYIRKLVLIVSLAFTMQSIILRGMPAAALQTDDDNMEKYPWAYGNYKCMNPDSCAGLEARLMIGLTSLLVISDNLNLRKSIHWNDADCVEHLTTLGAGEYCGICREASLGCAAVAFLSLATGFVNFYTDIQRMRARNDHNCIKSVAVISNVLGALQQLLAVSIFHGLCVREFPLEDEAKNFKLELEMGGGGALLASAAALNLFGIIIHVMIPVPEARWRIYGSLSSDDPAEGEWPSIRIKKSIRGGKSVAAFDGAVPDGALAEHDDVEGSGPGWDDDGKIMSKRAPASDMIRRASEAVPDVLSMLNASEGSRDSHRSSDSGKSVLSRISSQLR